MSNADRENMRANLRKLRDRLATEAPRARARASVPVELVRRLQSVLELVGRAYLLDPAKTPAPNAVDDAYEDATVEAHLVLHEWERCVELEKQGKPKPTVAPMNRRQHERQEIDIAVRLLRHTLREDLTGRGVTLDSQTTNRRARNVSLGGIFVAVPKDELPELVVGSVVHISVTAALGTPITFEARASVARREPTGLGLQWVQPTAQTRQAIAALLEALSRR